MGQSGLTSFGKTEPKTSVQLEFSKIPNFSKNLSLIHFHSLQKINFKGNKNNEKLL